MNDDYEPALVKARKLAASADPANGGSPGEVENARQALKRLCDRYGLSPERLDEEARRKLGFAVVSPDPTHKPWKDVMLLKLAVQILRYVVGESGNNVREWDLHRQKRKYAKAGRRKGFTCEIWIVEANVTALEHEEWQECFMHYAPYFIETRKRLKEQAAAARRAVKLAASAFINQHDIFPPDVEETTGGDLQRLQDLMMAMRCVQGETWERKAGALSGGMLLN
ncbi:hypothetical protein [Prosthecobacter sp.]|uniref:hypothetical protein n=1 Tax=Prosthecobacter sp. TaxID=1965333 RepID=UPI00378473BC